MTDAAVISGTLVDVRNVGTHKSVKLTIHVPAELAPNIFKAFGWPTDVNPVHVAVARLDPESQRQVERAETKPRPVQSPGSAGAEKVRRSFDEMSPAQQAGMLCGDPSFQQFLVEDFGCNPTKDDAASFVRSYCGVMSRSDIAKENAKWRQLVTIYRAWQREAEVVPA